MRVTPVSCAERNEYNEALLPWPRFASLVAEQGLDAMVVSTPENVTYVSEYAGVSHWARRGTQVYAVVWADAERSVDLVVPAALADQVDTGVAALTRPHAYGRFFLDRAAGALSDDDQRTLELATGADNPLAASATLEAVLRRGGVKRGRLAVEAGGLADGVLDRIGKAFPGTELRPADHLLASLRAVKSAREIATLERATRITERAIAAAVAQVRPGVRERDLACAFATALVAEGAEPEITVIASGRRSALPNGAPTLRMLEPGDIVRFDVGCRFEHYVSDIARTFAVDVAGEVERSIYRALSEGLEAAADALRPGATGGEIFAAAVGATRAAGLREYCRTHCGHGIGIANYDLPRITSGSEDVIEPGMVVCLETPYYRLGAFGVQVEDTFVVTDSGADRFSDAPLQLGELDSSGAL